MSVCVCGGGSPICFILYLTITIVKRLSLSYTITITIMKRLSLSYTITHQEVVIRCLSSG